ncbi:hypothetical protein C8R48DRAFT_668350 [Suillus tomentosus]|nr:hypothetical protein C8R48DRAFT_668350 [Suillus tomentosus]
MLCCCALIVLSPFCFLFAVLSFTTMATSASFHGVVGLQNGKLGDICVNVFTFGANTASAEDGIYLLDARTTIGSIVDDEGKSAHSLHLFANDDLQPMPDGACAFPMVIIAEYASSDMVTATDDSSEAVPSTTLSQFDWGGARKEKEQGTLKGGAKEKGKKEDGEKSDGKNDSKRACDDDNEKDRDSGPSTIACENIGLELILFVPHKRGFDIVDQYHNHTMLMIFLDLDVDYHHYLS